jgi:outer membrane protein assembly factor BamD (BamD/ComL family)
MRLAILNACEGGRASRNDPFAGTAQSLVQQGLPAVIAMQFEISDQAAITFTREFYAALADGYPVDAALTEARLAIFAANDSGLEWGTPVLYMRAPDGRIFDLTATPPKLPPLAAKPEARAQDKDLEDWLARRYTQALACFYTEQWDQAAEAFREILARRENYEDAAGKLAEATRQAELAAHYAEGQQALSAQAWAIAVERFQAVLALDAGYRDAAALLADAKRRKALADLYAEARRLHTAGTWPAVVKVFERIAAIDPAYPDSENLLASARAAIAADERERRLAGLYSQGIRSLDEGKLAEALAQFQEVQNLSPGYAQAEALLTRVKRLQVERQAAEQRRTQVADLYRRGAQRLQAGQLEEAQQYFEEIERLQPGYQDVEALLAQARQILAERKAAEQQRARLNDLYEQASSQLRLENWTEAERLCSQLLELQPHYRDAETLLAKARNRLASQRAAEERAARETAALPPPPAARSGKPTTLPEEIKPRPRPKDLPH